MIQNFFLDRGTALLIVLPDWHNVIACISSASQFNILEAIKVKGLVVLHKTYQTFSFMLAPLTLLPCSMICDILQIFYFSLYLPPKTDIFLALWGLSDVRGGSLYAWEIKEGLLRSASPPTLSITKFSL